MYKNAPFSLEASVPFCTGDWALCWKNHYIRDAIMCPAILQLLRSLSFIWQRKYHKVVWKELHFPRYKKFGIIAYTERSREEKVLFSEMINRVLGSHQTSVDITKGTFSCGWTPRAKLMDSFASEWCRYYMTSCYDGLRPAFRYGCSWKMHTLW